MDKTKSDGFKIRITWVIDFSSWRTFFPSLWPFRDVHRVNRKRRKVDDKTQIKLFPSGAEESK
jgi:hypothetical protein